MRLCQICLFSSFRAISIHAPLAGCDPYCITCDVRSIHFNPRTPCGVRLLWRGKSMLTLSISIHAPLAGCDHHFSGYVLFFLYFNPRTPCGVRLCAKLHLRLPCLFQSTHPLRGATSLCSGNPAASLFISIHAPLAGCDSKIAEIFPADLRKSYKISAKPNKERRCRVLGKGKAAAISGLARCEPPSRILNASGSHQTISAPSGS